VLSANTTALGGGACSEPSSRPCCSRTAWAVEHCAPKRALQRIDQRLGHIAQLDLREQVGSGGGGVHCLLYNKTYSFNGFTMDAITYSAARANLATTMNRVCQDHEPLIITRNGDQSVVMVSLEDYQALEETAYLLRNPTNARRLLSAAAQLAAGKGVKRDLTQ
jgi:antitoxin YefM